MNVTKYERKLSKEYRRKQIWCDVKDKQILTSNAHYYGCVHHNNRALGHHCARKNYDGWIDFFCFAQAEIKPKNENEKINEEKKTIINFHFNLQQPEIKRVMWTWKMCMSVCVCVKCDNVCKSVELKRKVKNCIQSKLKLVFKNNSLESRIRIHRKYRKNVESRNVYMCTCMC